MSQTSKIDKSFGSIEQTLPKNLNANKTDIVSVLNNRLINSNWLSQYNQSSEQYLDVLPLITNDIIICGNYYGPYQILRIPNGNELYDKLQSYNKRKINQFDSFYVTFINTSKSPVVLSTSVLPDDTETIPTIRFIGYEVINPPYVFDNDINNLSLSVGQRSTQPVIGIGQSDFIPLDTPQFATGLLPPPLPNGDGTYGWFPYTCTLPRIADGYYDPLKLYRRGDVVWLLEDDILTNFYILCGNSTVINIPIYINHPDQQRLVSNHPSFNTLQPGLPPGNTWNSPVGYELLTPDNFYSQYILKGISSTNPIWPIDINNSIVYNYGRGNLFVFSGYLYVNAPTETYQSTSSIKIGLLAVAIEQAVQGFSGLSVIPGLSTEDETPLIIL